jgi:hypothetical protein
LIVKKKVVYTKLLGVLGQREISDEPDASRFLFKVLRERFVSKKTEEE